jgi:hypothetical protein
VGIRGRLGVLARSRGGGLPDGLEYREVTRGPGRRRRGFLKDLRQFLWAAEDSREGCRGDMVKRERVYGGCLGALRRGRPW